MVEFIVQCAWCGNTKLKDKWALQEQKNTIQVSHGICPHCKSKHFSLIQKPLDNK